MIIIDENHETQKHKNIKKKPKWKLLHPENFPRNPKTILKQKRRRKKSFKQGGWIDHFQMVPEMYAFYLTKPFKRNLLLINEAALLTRQSSNCCKNSRYKFASASWNSPESCLALGTNKNWPHICSNVCRMIPAIKPKGMNIYIPHNLFLFSSFQHIKTVESKLYWARGSIKFQCSHWKSNHSSWCRL